MSDDIQPAPMGTQKAQVSPRLLRAALGISVAINLLVAGLVIGSLFHNGARDGSRGEMTRDLAFGPLGESLRPEDRRALRAYLQARAPELRNAAAQRRADIAAVQAALRAAPFDPGAFAAAIDAMQGRLQGQLGLGFDALKEVVSTMPEDERRAMADRLDRGLRHPKGEGARMGKGQQGGGEKKY